MAYRPLTSALLGLVAAALPLAAWAWGADGHQAVGALADRLIAGTPAAAKVKSLLGGLSLREAGPWADCARSVGPGPKYEYDKTVKGQACEVFKTDKGIAEMQDFVRRNDGNCQRKPHEHACHTMYHFVDIGVQRDHYDRQFYGTRDVDLVAATAAAIAVLQGHEAPAPFDIRSQREALLLLAHYLGDIHQPLHVGSVYLDSNGKRIDPDPGPPDHASENFGGNDLVPVDVVTKKEMGKLHAMWDDVPGALLSGHVDAAWLAKAKAVPPTPGEPTTWPAAWATGTLLSARNAFDKVRFGPRHEFAPTHTQIWNATLPLHYRDAMNAAKQTQITLAGARLAQVLQAAFP